MTETEYRLDKSYSVALDSNGGAILRYVGPAMAGENWRIESIAVNTSAPCRFRVFRGDIQSGKQIAATSRGDDDTSPDVVILKTGEYLSFNWDRGQPNSTGIVKLEGTYRVPGKRSY